jgi:hypothetical protein
MTTMNKEINNQYQGIPTTGSQGNNFEIHIKGQLDESWSEWLEGMEVILQDNGEMILFGHIEDQAALMGILNKLYRLNLALLSISRVDQKK